MDCLCSCDKLITSGRSKLMEMLYVTASLATLSCKGFMISPLLHVKVAVVDCFFISIF